MSELGARLNAIHEKLLAGRPTASLELFEAALTPLIRFLKRKFRNIREEAAYDFAVDAIMAHVDDPSSFDSSKSALWTYLCMVARRNVQDCASNAKNRSELAEKYGYGIELWGVQANNLNETVENAQDAEAIMRLHGDVIAKNEIEKRVLGLFLAGESEVSLYADAMGLDAGADAPAEVKRIQDRLKARLKKVRDEL
ncbi:hypothetical protein QA633_40090 [Bradyrhizobium barranii]|uniref:hypothetical protein n=1 Tax=Bradyrhizobium barranii TaxID=2992140 RepID=UPI0024AF770A|nr:hypothetical protein [Bradyrhizobium barranii]WFT94392.1 hypothetical protein QA633_40090 [Bradyrhizobium barranii]